MLNNVLFNIIQNFPVRFPYHKYLGPGNKINNGIPVDIDDLIALQHDIDYLNARKQEDIFQADIRAAQKFYTHFITELDFHSLCGWVGLTLKNHLENQVGLLYPVLEKSSMVPPVITKPTHRGNKLYAERMKRLGQEYQERKRRGEQLTWGDFIKQQKISGSDQPGTSGYTSKPTTVATDFEDNSALESPLSMTNRSPVTVEEVEMLETGNVQDPESAHGMGAGAHNSISTQSTNKQYLRIPRSIRLKSFTLNFGKSRIFYSYAYAFRNLLDKKTGANNIDLGDQIYITTSLAMVPNDMLGFYMSPYELGLIANYGLVKIKRCSVTVVPQGLRTAFDTGTTLSGTATSEHCAIGISNVGLNQKYYCRYGAYSSIATSPMVPTGLKDVDLPGIMTKYYGDVEMKEHAPMSLGVPRHVDHYYMPMLNSNRVVPNYSKHSNGPPILDKFLDRFNFMPVIGEKIIDWEYFPSFGYLDVKAHEIPYIVNDSDIVYTNNLFSHIPQKVQVTCSKESITATKVNVNSEAYSTQQTDNSKVLYYTIDGAKVFAPYDDSFSSKAVHKAVPLIHVGLLPTPALNPASDNTTFQNSCAYWSIKCDIIIEYNLESSFHHKASSRAHAYNDEVVFLPARDINNYGTFQPLCLESFGA